jgi:4-amino-4-deoxy-L-arabinose transferase-like glycosyltransferase
MKNIFLNSINSASRFLRQNWAILLVLLMAFGLRVNNLLLNAVDWDEANTLAISQMSLKDMFWFSFMHDIHPPGWNLLLSIWTFFFKDSDLSLRCCSLLWSLLAVLASYLLSFELSKSKFVGLLTALMISLMPLAIRYSHFATAPSANFALVLLSWYLFLKTLRLPQTKNILKEPLLWGYGIVSLWATQLYAAGPFFFMFQGLYFLLIFERIPKAHRKSLLVVGTLIILASIPHIWIISQPWHMSHLPELKHLHSIPSFLFFFLSPLSMLAYNYDLRVDDNDLSLIPPILDLMKIISLFYPFLIYCFWQLFQRNRQVFTTVLFIGILPWLTAYLLGFANFNFFNFRSLLYTAFAFYFAISCFIHWAWQAKKRLIAVLSAISIVSMQWFLPIPLEKFSSLDWRKYAQNLKATYQPGDGIIVFGGVMALPLLRYYDKKLFGYPHSIIAQDPRNGESSVKRVDRIDQTYFMVTGKVTERVEVQRAFVEFQKKHKRILWILFHPFPTELGRLIDCNREGVQITAEAVRQLNCISH